MNIFDDILSHDSIDTKFFEQHPNIIQKWKKYQHHILKQVLKEQYSLQNERDNFDCYLDEYIKLLNEKLNIKFFHPRGKYGDNSIKPTHLFKITVNNCHFVYPESKQQQKDYPLDALIRGSYEASVYGNIVLSIYMLKYKHTDKIEPFVSQKSLKRKRTKKETFHFEATLNDEDDNVDEDEDDDDLMIEDYVSDEDDVEKEAGKDDDDDEDEDDDHKSTDDIKMKKNINLNKKKKNTVSINDDSEDEDEDEDEEDDDDEEDIDTYDEPPLTDMSDDSNDEYLGMGDEFKIEFNIIKSKKDYDLVLVHQETTYKLLHKFPAMLKSQICSLQHPIGNIKNYIQPQLKGSYFCVGHHFQSMEYTEYMRNNFCLMIKKDTVQIRSKFEDFQKRYRTNNTLKIELIEKKRSNSNTKSNYKLYNAWYNLPSFIMTVPYEKNNVPLSLMVLMNVYGWSVSFVIKMLKKRIPKNDWRQFKSLYEFFFIALRHSVAEIHSRSDAFTKLSKYYSKCGQLDGEDKYSYLCFQLRQEYLPSLIDFDVDIEQLNDEERKHIFQKENNYKNWLLFDALYMLIQQSDMINNNRPDHEKWTLTDEASLQNKRCYLVGQRLATLLKEFITEINTIGYNEIKKCVRKKFNIKPEDIINPSNINITARVQNGNFNVSKKNKRDSKYHQTQMVQSGYNNDIIITQSQKLKKYGVPTNYKVNSFLPHPTYSGRWCIYTTPESKEKCGISWSKALGGFVCPLLPAKKINQNIIKIFKHELKHLVIMNHVDSEFFDASSFQLFDFLDEHYYYIHDGFGRTVGFTKQPIQLFTELRNRRRRGIIHKYVGFSMDQKLKIFYIHTDEGRTLRPLCIAKNIPDCLKHCYNISNQLNTNQLHLLLRKQWIEYIDPNEEYSGWIKVAQDVETWQKESKYNYTHVEIHGVLHQSLTLAKSYINHNQGPRRTQMSLREKTSHKYSSRSWNIILVINVWTNSINF